VLSHQGKEPLGLAILMRREAAFGFFMKRVWPREQFVVDSCAPFRAVLSIIITFLVILNR
jgi:hypothetical protein